MAIDLIFGKERIKTIRERLHLNVREFAELMSVTTMTIYRWESGDREPTEPRHLQRLLEAERDAQEKGGA